MAYNQSSIGRVYASAQSDYTTGVAAATVISSGMPIECEFYPAPTQREVFERAAITGGFYELPPISGSQHGATFSLKMPLHGFSTSVPTDNPADHPEYVFMKSVLGGGNGANYFAGEVVASGSDADTIKLSGAQTENFRVGNAAAFLASDGSTYDIGFIDHVDSAADTLSLRVPMSISAVTDSSASYGSNTAYLSTGAPTSFTFVTRSVQNNSQVLLTGCVPTSFSISMGPKDQLIAEFEFIANTIEGSTASDAITDYDYTYPVLPVPIGSNAARCVFRDGSSATAIDVKSLSVSAEQTLVPQLGHGATTGVRDLLVSDRNVTMTFTSILGTVNPYDTSPDGIPQLDLENTAANIVKSIQFSIMGAGPGQGFAMALMEPINMNPAELADDEGILVQNFTLKPGNYSGDTVDASDVAGNSDFRVAFV